MTVVHPNHIVGINSITVQTGDSLSVHKADGSLIRTIVSNTGVSTFHAVEVSKGGGDLNVGVSTFFVDNSAGKVGIGTDIPGQTLHLSAVSGDVYNRVDTNVNGGMLIYVQGTQRSVFANDSAFSGTTTDTGIGAKGNLLFRTGTSSYDERLRIASDGDVGIGTDSPQSAGLTVLRHSEARLQVWANGDGSNGKVALRADGTNTQMGTWSNHDCHLVRNASIQATISSTGISLPAGKGIDFSATSDASGMTSELFADYERGVHTFAVTGAGGNPTVNIQSGYDKLYYTKIGDMVHVTGEMRWTISSHGSGDLRISIPFTSDNSAQSNCQGTAQTWNVNWKYGRSDAEYLLSEVVPGANYMIFRVACNNSLNEPYLNCGSNYQKTSNSGYGVEYQVSIWYRTG